MFNSKTIRRVTLSSLATILFGTGQGFAHTSVKDQIDEGTTPYTAIAIGHTCENATTGKALPIIAQSVVFPTVNPTVTRSDGQPTTLGAELEITDRTGAGFESLAGLPTVVQDRSIFKKQTVTYDGNGNAIGFSSTRGDLQSDLRGLVPFRINRTIKFKADSCAKKLMIQVAIADICKKTFPPKAGTANLWIPANTATFTDSKIDGIGEPATLTINRKTATNPLPASCGTGYDVTVTPSNEDIDAHLPFKGWGK